MCNVVNVIVYLAIIQQVILIIADIYTYWFLDIDGERKGAATFVLSFEYNMHSKCSYENISKQIDSTLGRKYPEKQYSDAKLLNFRDPERRGYTKSK